MKYRQLILSITLVLSAGSLALRATAQNDQPLGVLTGTVYDINGAVISRSRVFAYGLTGSQYEATTSGEGVYRIQAPPDVYTIVATAPGFCLKRMSRFRLIKTTAGQLALDVVLEVADERKPCAVDNMPARKPTNKTQKQSRPIAE